MALASDFLGGVVGNLNAGSAIANGVSFEAQGRAANFNSQMMANSQAFNSAAAAQQVAYNKDLWSQAAKYNAEQAAYANKLDSERWEDYKAFQAQQAQLNRDFQERMSNTAYQRAVADMMKAGINPILAAQVGGATTPSGSTATIAMPSGKMASMGSASAGLPSSGMASISGFTGQGNNMSENLAMFGAIASMFGNGMSGLAEALDLTKAAQVLADAFNKGDRAGLNPFRDKNGNKKTEGITGWINETANDIKNFFEGKKYKGNFKGGGAGHIF